MCTVRCTRVQGRRLIGRILWLCLRFLIYTSCSLNNMVHEKKKKSNNNELNAYNIIPLHGFTGWKFKPFICVCVCLYVHSL